MHRLARRTAVAVVSVSLVLTVPGSAGAALSTRERAERAVGYIASQQNPNGAIGELTPGSPPIGLTADAVVAVVAARRGAPTMRDALRYLERQVERGNVDSIGLRAKVALAFATAGRNPRDVGGTNLVRELRQAFSDGAAPIVFDTALAVLALAGADARVPPAATGILVDNQCPDGGWPFDAFDETTENEHCFSGDAGSDFFLSDTNSTALAIMALDAARVDPASNPFAFLRDIRDERRGGWGFTWGVQKTDANSTALVLQAYRASGRTVPRRGAEALRSLQYPRCGAFAHTFEAGERNGANILATIGAVPGLRPVALPFSREVSGPAPDTPRCRTA